MAGVNLNIPKHVAIIMDGNGRWAKKKLMPRNFGHKAGVKKVDKVIEYCIETGVETLTLYAFSTENWKRPKDEIDGIFKLIGNYFDKASKKYLELGVRVRVLGTKENLSDDLIGKIDDIEKMTSNQVKLNLNICFNYSGRKEIIDAIIDMKNRNADITEDELNRSLYTKGIGDPDLLIRTSGEYRLSNFLIFQSAYSELYFTEVLWPDFNKKEFNKALANYSARNRRFGGV